MTARASSAWPFAKRKRGDSGMKRLSRISESPVGIPKNHMIRQLYVGISQCAVQLAIRKPSAVPSPATSTTASPRRRAGIVSASSEYAIGSSPPALTPMTKQATRFQWNAGIALHIDVPMKSVAASRIDARRPMLSPSRPQISEPTTVPMIATNGKSATGQCPGAGCDGRAQVVLARDARKDEREGERLLRVDRDREHQHGHQPDVRPRQLALLERLELELGRLVAAGARTAARGRR